MATAKLILIGRDTNGETNSMTISNAQPTLASGASETVAINMSMLNTAMRSIHSLSRDTYIDTNYQVTFSVNEEVEG